MSGNEKDLLRARRLQALGLIPKPDDEDVPLVNAPLVNAPLENAHQDNAPQENAPQENAPQANISESSAPLNKAEPIESNTPSHISLTFNIYPSDQDGMAHAIAGLARTLSELCTVNGLTGAQPCSTLWPRVSSLNMAESLPTSKPSAPLNDSWLFEMPDPINQSTPRSNANASGPIVIPSDDSKELLSDACGGPSPPQSRKSSLNCHKVTFGEGRYSQPDPPKRNIASRSLSHVEKSRSIGLVDTASSSLSHVEKSKSTGPAPSTGAIRKLSSKASVKQDVDSNSSVSESNHSFKTSKTDGKSFKSQMAALFKNHAKLKEKSRGAKHFLSDSSETSQEILPKKKCRTDPPKEVNELPPDDDPNMGRCPICLDNPKNCKIRCKHVFCEKCLIKLKSMKKGCPFDSFRFRKWEKLI